MTDPGKDAEIPREALAVHEAGHVVASVLADVPLRSVTIEPEGGGESYQGHTDLRRSAVSVRERVFVDLAGLAAETLYGLDSQPDASFLDVLEGDRAASAESDLDDALRTLQGPPLNLSSHHAVVEVRAMFNCARLNLRRYEADVRRVATRLREAGTLREEELVEMRPELDAADGTPRWEESGSE